MKRREYLAAATTGTVAGTAGCFWEDGNSKAQLGLLIVSNYFDSPQRFVVHVEEDGEDALTTEIELASGADGVKSQILDCGWSTEPGQFTVEIFQLTDPTDSVEVSIPGERTKDEGATDCVGLSFLAGVREFDHIAPRVHSCTDVSDDIELCVDKQ